MTLRGFKDWGALMLETYSGTAERISQQESQLAVSVMHVPILALGYLDQGIDHNSKRRQTLINHSGFLEALTLCLRGFRAFRSRKINYMEAGGLHFPHAFFVHCLALDRRGEH